MGVIPRTVGFGLVGGNHRGGKKKVSREEVFWGWRCVCGGGGGVKKGGKMVGGGVCGSIVSLRSIIVW